MEDLINRWETMRALQAINPVAKLMDGDIVIKISEVENVLEHMPPIQPYTTTHESIPAETGKNDGDRTSDDCISRQAALNLFPDDNLYWDKNEGYFAPHYARTLLRNLPSTQPEREKGEWVYNSPVTMKCNRCGLVIKDWDWHRFKICPNCGADMRGEKNG